MVKSFDYNSGGRKSSGDIPLAISCVLIAILFIDFCNPHEVLLSLFASAISNHSPVICIEEISAIDGMSNESTQCQS